MRSQGSMQRTSTTTGAFRLAAAAALYLLLVPPPAHSQQESVPRFRGSAAASSLPMDEVSGLSRQGRHFEAVHAFMELPNEATLAAKLSAAKSAWALGLVSLARTWWDEALADKQFKDVERSRTMLARSILELQESNFEAARSFAERGAGGIEPSELRSQFWLVIGEALKSQGAWSLAEEYYRRAVEEAGAGGASEARFLLGECQLNLGKLNESRYTFVGVDTGSSYTAPALRRLAELDLQQRDFEGVLTWIEEGREHYSSEFNDGWSTYAYVTALLELGRSEIAESEINRLKVQHSDQDPWFLLAESAFEARRATEITPELAQDNR